MAQLCDWLTFLSQPIRIASSLPIHPTSTARQPITMHAATPRSRSTSEASNIKVYSQNVRNNPKINNKSWESFSFHLGSGQFRNLPPISIAQKDCFEFEISMPTLHYSLSIFTVKQRETQFLLEKILENRLNTIFSSLKT